MTRTLIPFFAPQGVALIGASSNPQKIGAAILRNLTEGGYRGRVYPVNPRCDQIGGLPCYASIADVPDPVDLAVIVLPAPLTPPVLKACGRRGLKAAIIISSGFKETGPEGAAVEAECAAIAGDYGMRLIGPNCLGTMDLSTGLNTTFLEGRPAPGRIGFISQSGGVCGGGISYANSKQIGFSRFVSLGNEADVTETDIIAYLADDPNTHVIAVYVEGIKDGPRFMEVARRVTRHKPIVLLKAGRTEAGSRAVSSHTGALAGSRVAYETAFRQCGIIEAFSITDLFDISLALACQPLPAGNRVFVLTNSGGPAALATDSLALYGLDLPHLRLDTTAALTEGLDPVIQIANPIDMLGGAGPQEYEFALPVILSDPNIDAVLVILVPHLLLNPTETATRISRMATVATKPIMTCFVGEDTVSEARRILHRHHIPMYNFPEVACRALSQMSRYAEWRRNERPDRAPAALDMNREAIQSILEAANGLHALAEARTRPVLTACDIPVIAGEIARSPEAAVKIAAELGYPVVLKIVSADILHKSETDGIRLNLNSSAAVATAYHELMQTASMANPEAELEGVLVQKMASEGYEVIIGMRRDPQFGPLVMVGLGGIYVELLTEVSFRVAPISEEEALAMIHETSAGRLLSGLRGRPAADIKAVVDCVLRLSRLGLAFPQIQEVEVNPLLVLPQGQGAVALDGRIILSSN
jgi:acetyltransferase